MRRQPLRGCGTDGRAQQQLRPHEEGHLSGLPLKRRELRIERLVMQPPDRRSGHSGHAARAITLGNGVGQEQLRSGHA
eukprot:5825068-Amphidinium_carterae.1